MENKRQKGFLVTTLCCVLYSKLYMDTHSTLNAFHSYKNILYAHTKRLYADTIRTIVLMQQTKNLLKQRANTNNKILCKEEKHKKSCDAEIS